jgi:Zn-dependent protease
VNTIIWTSAAALMFLAILASHEAGHAFALRRYGVPIVEAGLGLPYGPRLILQPTRRRPFRLSFSLILVGAYVTPDEERAKELERLPYIDQAWWAGAGVAVNIVTGATVGAALCATNGRWTATAVFAAVAVAVAALPRHFCAYVVPALSVPVLGFLLWSLTTTGGEPSGPVGVGRALNVSTPFGAFATAAGIALSIGLFNMIPIFPFDGGRIARLLALRWGGNRADKAFQAAGTLLALGLLGYLILGDAWWAVSG